MFWSETRSPCLFRSPEAPFTDDMMKLPGPEPAFPVAVIVVNASLLMEGMMYLLCTDLDGPTGPLTPGGTFYIAVTSVKELTRQWDDPLRVFTGPSIFQQFDQAIKVARISKASAGSVAL